MGTTLYYGTPDVIASRTARAWVKYGLLAVVAAASAPELRAAWDGTREQQGPDGEASLSTIVRSLPAGSKAVAVGVGTAALVSSVGSVLLAERWIFRRGQARAAAGRRLPHTGPALLYGALSAGLWLLPTPTDTP